MEISLSQQIFQQLTLAKKVIIALPQNLTADDLSGGLALKLFLQKMEKDVLLASSGKIPQNLFFLPGVQDIKNGISQNESLAVILDTSVNKLEEISYQTKNDHVHIYLKAKSGKFSPENITVSNEKAGADAVIILGCSSLEDLGILFESNTNLFYETPKINIDHRASNEYFGSINLVDINASSLGEILASLFEKYEHQLVDEDIATCLLAGIITKTQNFQHAQTTPSAFTQASSLIAQGGKHQDIIRYIYKTKSLAVLKLWGRALARIKQDEKLSVVYSLLNFSDIEKSGASEEDLPQVLAEIIEVVPSYKHTALFVETEGNSVQLYLHGQDSSAKKIAEKLAGKEEIESITAGNLKLEKVRFLGLGLADAEKKFLEILAG